MTVHPVVSGGFSSAASTFARIRPTYARQCIGRLGELAREHGSDPRVLDVGAGTGILTGQMRSARLGCVAVEPLPAMVVQLRLSLPSTPACLGDAEALPVQDRSVALVTAARAFHLFGASGALPEAARVLAHRGWLALVWNQRDDAVPWVAALSELVGSAAGTRPHADHGEIDWSGIVAGDDRFDDLITESFPNPVPATIDGVLRGVRSMEVVAALETDRRSELLAEASALLSSQPELSGTFEDPCHTVLHRARRR